MAAPEERWYRSKTPPSPAPVVTYSYDLAGRVTGVSDTSAAVTAAVPPAPNTKYTTSYVYDALNRPTGVSWDPAPAPTLPAATSVTFTHTYNKVNQRVGQSATDNTWLTYPAASPSTTSYTANAVNQYTAVGAVTPSYDGQRQPDRRRDLHVREVMSRSSGSGRDLDSLLVAFAAANRCPPRLQVLRDAENRLVSASGAGNTVAYAYDAQGRRKSRTVNGATTLFVTAADNREVLEYSGAGGAPQRWYASGLGANDALSQMNLVAATRTTFIPDLQGSMIATLDSSTSAFTKHNYLPYGASASTAGTFRYTGQRIDAETGGLYYYRARMYKPAWGRFMQTDPIGYQGGINLYAYVGNDPLNLIDPLGLAADGTNSANTIAFPGAGGGGILAGAGRALGAIGAGAVGLTAAVVAAIILGTTTSTADRTQDEIQYVVRAGAGAPRSFEEGTRLTPNGYGFSVQTAPGVMPDELARGGYFKNRQVSVSTVHELQAIPGVIVNFPTPGAGDYHGTVNVPNPPPAGFFYVISGAFRPQINPHQVP